MSSEHLIGALWSARTRIRIALAVAKTVNAAVATAAARKGLQVFTRVLANTFAVGFLQQ